MGALDLLIIYLTCGAPFAVFQITSQSRAHPLRYALTVAGSFLLWPVAAVILVVNRFGSSVERKLHEHRARLEVLRVSLERSVFTDADPMSAVFAFREVFYRFFGLAEAASQPSSKRAYEIFSLTRHPNPALASRCLERKNRAQLEKHKARAEHELNELLPTDRRVEISALFTGAGHDLAAICDDLPINARSVSEGMASFTTTARN